jgi:hypothetical protein
MEILKKASSSYYNFINNMTVKLLFNFDIIFKVANIM